jgi:hypothetical protein
MSEWRKLERSMREHVKGKRSLKVRVKGEVVDARLARMGRLEAIKAYFAPRAVAEGVE